jgi:hypothetical protein
MDLINNQSIINLFINYFDINEDNSPEYTWNNIKPIFEFLIQKLNNKTGNELISYYYIFTILYINYTNYLKFYKHPDFVNEEVYNLIKIIKFDKNILKNILINIDIKYVKNIFKIYNPFISAKLVKIKINDVDKINNIIDEYIKNSKQFDKIFELKNNNYKKTLNIIIYRFLLSQSTGHKNYHEFYIKNILDYPIHNNNNLDNFIKQIPHSKNILNFRINAKIISNLQINIESILDFFKMQNPLIKIEINNNDFSIIHIKYNGKIIISNDKKYKYNENILQFNYFQQNYGLFYFNMEELKKFNFLRKSNNFMVIYIEEYQIADLSTMLNLFHILTISIKILESYPTKIYEILYPLDYSNYYYKSFYNFFSFNKSEINKNLGYNKFIIDLIKYCYIYSYYDFYFYYVDNLLNSLIKNFKFKNKIIMDFFNNLKITLKLPNELSSSPPFVNVNPDVDNLLFYSYSS